jgi:hypothetical protein
MCDKSRMGEKATCATRAAGHRRFCVLTSGRAGSTSLMQALAARTDAGLPSRDVGSWGEELLNPKFITRHARLYARLTGRRIGGHEQLIDAFFAHHAARPRAGFKLLPKQHAEIDAFVERPDIDLIVLARRDAASTVASMVTARLRNYWPRAGGPQPRCWRFADLDRALVEPYVRELDTALAVLASVRAEIVVHYESLCDPHYTCPALDAYFGCSIRLARPLAPTRGRDYVEDWDAFEEYVGERVRWPEALD